MKLLIAAIEDQEVHARLNGRKLWPEDFKVRVLVCLDPPGWMYLDRENVRQARNPEIVHGPVNDPEDLDGIDYSTMTILREDLNKHWSLDEQRVSSSKLTHPKEAEGLAKNYSDTEALNAAREIYDSAKARGLPPPNKRQAYIEMSKKGFPRSVAQPVLEKPEFAQRRRKPGNQTLRRRAANLQERT